MALPLNRFTRKLYDIEDRLFEVFHGLELGGYVRQEDLVTTSKSKLRATAYQPVWTSNMRVLLSFFSDEEVRNYTFLDVGCGKGKPSFYATKYPFKSIEGFDFDEELIESAQRNREKSRWLKAQNVSFRVGDAASIVLDSTPYVLFLFNPFDEEITRQFLENNASILRSNNSYLCYANHRNRSVLEACGMKQVFVHEERKLSIWRC